MGNQYVTLRFELKRYTEDGEDTEQQIIFEGYRGWQRMQFFEEPPSENQLKLLAELARILKRLEEEE